MRGYVIPPKVFYMSDSDREISYIYGRNQDVWQ